MKIGDQLKLTDQRAQMDITCEVTSKDVFCEFKEMLRAKGPLNMLPQLRDRAKGPFFRRLDPRRSENL